VKRTLVYDNYDWKYRLDSYRYDNSYDDR